MPEPIHDPLILAEDVRVRGAFAWKAQLRSDVDLVVFTDPHNGLEIGKYLWIYPAGVNR